MPVGGCRTSINFRLNFSRGSFQSLHLRQSSVHTAHDVEAGLQGLDQSGNPIVRNKSARIRHADDETAGAFCKGLARGGRRQTGRHRAAFAGGFSDALIGHPVTQTERGFGVTSFHGIARKRG